MREEAAAAGWAGRGALRGGARFPPPPVPPGAGGEGREERGRSPEGRGEASAAGREERGRLGWGVEPRWLQGF